MNRPLYLSFIEQLNRLFTPSPNVLELFIVFGGQFSFYVALKIRKTKPALTFTDICNSM